MRQYWRFWDKNLSWTGRTHGSPKRNHPCQNVYPRSLFLSVQSISIQKLKPRSWTVQPWYRHFWCANPCLYPHASQLFASIRPTSSVFSFCWCTVMSDNASRPELVIAIDFGMTCMIYLIIFGAFSHLLHRYRRRVLQHRNWRRKCSLVAKMAWKI